MNVCSIAKRSVHHNLNRKDFCILRSFRKVERLTGDVVGKESEGIDTSVSKMGGRKPKSPEENRWRNKEPWLDRCIAGRNELEAAEMATTCKAELSY